MMVNLVNSQDMPQGRELLKVQECDKLNKTIRDPLNTALAEWVNSIEGTGFIKFNLEKMQNDGGLDSMKSLLGMSNPNSFTVVNETISKVNPDVTFVTMQQYYNGIYVEGGGYVQGFINCVTFFMNAYIMEDINIGLSPSLIKQQAIASAQGHESGGAVFGSTNPEDDVQLVIDRDLAASCNYILAWKMSYLIGNQLKTAFVNAANGSVYKESLQKRCLNAPTADYGEVTLDDSPNFQGGSLTLLKTPSNSVRTFDKSGTNEGGLFSSSNTLFSPSLLPTTTETSLWPTTGPDEHEPEVYQAHYVTTNARDALDAFGLQFPTTFFVAGHPNVEGAGYFTNTYGPNNNTVEEALYFRWLKDDNGVKLSTALFDAAGHELTHMHLSGKFGNGGEPGGIEEAICDIFGEFAEQNCPSGLIDWIPGGQNGLKIRDMVNPEIPNYFPEIGEEDDVHDIAGPMNRWFTILVDGGTFQFAGQNFVVSGMNINAAAQILLSSINFMTSGSDYFDARAATIVAAELIYGECSDEVEAVATAWYAVGVGYPAHCKLIVAGALHYCEEYLGTSGGNVDLILVNPISGYTYKWIYPFDWHAIGESSPQTYIGTHLRMYQYGYMPNFPRFYDITLKEYNNNVFQKYRHITVKIKDCDGDDPTHPCASEVDALIANGNENNTFDNLESPKTPEHVAIINGKVIVPSFVSIDQEYRYLIYDVSGRKVKDGILGDDYSLDELPSSGIYFLNVYDGQYKLIQLEKICHIK